MKDVKIIDGLIAYAEDREIIKRLNKDKKHLAEILAQRKKRIMDLLKKELHNPVTREVIGEHIDAIHKRVMELEEKGKKTRKKVIIKEDST
ncbi:MAG: hypothetical protein Q7T34_01705 [Candidatus Parcubacteria bacterium]|nr:hypothetical protein [Candidatus Parcubacteria bacterium]